MTKNNFVLVDSVIFLAIGVMHALRLLYGWEATIGSYAVPMWLSWVAVLVALYLAFQGFRLAKN